MRIGRYYRAAVAVCTMLLPNAVSGQTGGSLWVAPHMGLGFEGEYHDAIVTFTDGDQELLRLEPQTALILGVQLGMRVGTAWSVHANVSTSKSDATYVENNNVRPDVGIRSTQLEVGMSYDLSSLPVGGRVAPFTVGGGLSLMSHALDPFQWSGQVIEPSTTSLGLHGLAALEIPLASALSLRSQVKLTANSLSLGDLNDAIALAEGTPIATPLDGGWSMFTSLTMGLSFRP